MTVNMKTVIPSLLGLNLLLAGWSAAAQVGKPLKLCDLKLPAKLQLKPLAVPGRGPGRFPGRGPLGQPAKPQPVKWNEKQIVLTAVITAIKQGPTALSLPPIFNHTLTFKIGNVLRGGLQKGGVIQAHHSARQHKKPTFPKGKVVVALSQIRGGLRIEGLEPADEGKIAAIQLACELPHGWKNEDGKVVSPWAAQKKRAWPDAQKVDAKHLCAVTGRPALLAGSGVVFQVAKVPPQKAIKWTNPDGDGEYKIIVSNPTDQPLIVEALRRVGKKILWKESLLIQCQGKTYTAPGSIGLLRPTEPVTLQPGENVSTVVNALKLDGPSWPRGGYRIEFQFCLGERSSKQSFYYMSRHHDVIRGTLKKQMN